MSADRVLVAESPCPTCGGTGVAAEGERGLRWANWRECAAEVRAWQERDDDSDPPLLDPYYVAACLTFALSTVERLEAERAEGGAR